MLGGNIKADDTSACREHSPTILAGKPLTFTGILKTGINLVTQLIHHQVAQRHERPENLLATNAETPIYRKNMLPLNKRLLLSVTIA